ncbi:MAG: hypothetical protein ACTS9Y_00565 [Methylophilus sp.]|uniref:hypothetical protein n=1 Tax=Methylophilus sp. TaxID=29541 RepID=UPI003F9EF2EC
MLHEYIRSLLDTAEGREQLTDALMRIVKISDSTPVMQFIDIRLIAYNAGHRVVNRKLDTDKPVSLIEVDLSGFNLYIVHDGNHRIEQAKKSQSNISAFIYKSTLSKYFVSADGTYFTRNVNDPPWILNVIPDSLSKVLVALNLLPTLDKRTFVT